MSLVRAGLALSVVLAVGCSATEEVDGVAGYCAVVERTEAAMAGTDPGTKRPAMAELRDAAPAEIRGDWDVVFALEAGDPTERALAQGRIDAFDAERC